MRGKWRPVKVAALYIAFVKCVGPAGTAGIVLPLARYGKRASLADDCASEGRARRSGQLDMRIHTDHVGLTRNDYGLEVARPRLKQSAPTSLFLDEHFSALTKEAEIVRA
jgi:hypothetical protein